MGDSGCGCFGDVSDEVQQPLLLLVHLSDVFRLFGHLHHQGLQSSPQSCNPTRHLMRNFQLEPKHITEGKGQLLHRAVTPTTLDMKKILLDQGPWTDGGGCSPVIQVHHVSVGGDLLPGKQQQLQGSDHRHPFSRDGSGADLRTHSRLVQHHLTT